MRAVSLRILVAEDDADMRAGIAADLTEAGHDVVAVADGAAALERTTRSPFDLLLSDVRLPGLDGLALFRRARQHDPNLDVILMTSYGSVADAVEALKAGARDYLTKPFESDELLARVASIAERRAVVRELAGPIAPLTAVVKQAEREHLLRALAAARGKRGRAADLLGISRKSLWEKMRAYGISESDLDADAG